MDLYLKIPLKGERERERETDMLPAEFEPTVSPSTRPQTHALDRATAGIGNNIQYCNESFGD